MSQSVVRRLTRHVKNDTRTVGGRVCTVHVRLKYTTIKNEQSDDFFTPMNLFDLWRRTKNLTCNQYGCRRCCRMFSPVKSC